MFFTPLELHKPGAQYTPNEPYYYERNNGITTWIRPFDYNQPEDHLEIARKWITEHRIKQQEQLREKALRDRPKKQTRLEGAASEWAVVDTVQGRVYYYNHKSGLATWDKPAEVVEWENREEEGTEMVEEDAEWMLQQMMADAEAQGLDEEEDIVYESEPEMPSKLLSREERTAQFKQMLLDSSINVFATWESQLPLFQNDPRLGGLPSLEEQQDVFDQVCAQLVEERKKLKKKQEENPSKKTRARGKAVDAFGELLEESVTKKTSFVKFCQRNLRDPRYLSIKTSREREKRFLEHVESLQSSKKSKH
ncbi:hypothetical protein GGI07_002605 [Coemansia sp. Benny D115]|nr:hypothetical protein GGI07_002605 [Coemansia sp. Benny D115]